MPLRAHMPLDALTCLRREDGAAARAVGRVEGGERDRRVVHRAARLSWRAAHPLRRAGAESRRHLAHSVAERADAQRRD
eukprot:494153-Prymnesium_polylepis.1